MLVCWAKALPGTTGPYPAKYNYECKVVGKITEVFADTGYNNYHEPRKGSCGVGTAQLLQPQMFE